MARSGGPSGAAADGGAASDAATVEVDGVHKSFGATRVLRDVSIGVAAGTMVALLGPSGCGKTTLLRIIAGLETADAGVIRLGERTVTGAGTDVPPEKRRVGMVFQDWALFPHLSVAKNVGYGLPRAERDGDRVDRALAMVGLSGMGDRVPGTLSGGQQQRVALARAIAPEPSVLLLDEPFSNLDTALRVQVRTEVHHLLLDLGITTLFVTHDQQEAFILGDDVAVMSEGRVVQQASPADLYGRPATPWVARFVGDANLVPGVAEGDHAHTPIGVVPLETRHHGAVQVLLRPEEIRLESATSSDDGLGGSHGPIDSALVGPATIGLVEFYGHDTVYDVELPDATTVKSRAGSAPRFRRGDPVTATYGGGPTVAYPVATADPATKAAH